MHKPKFTKQTSSYFHFNFEFRPHAFLKDLDWIRLCRTINSASYEHKIECISCVMLDTHTHLLIKSIDRQENFFSFDLQNKLGLISHEQSQLEPITNYSQFLNTYKYIYRNPVEAGLSELCENYAYSSLACLTGKSVNRLIVWDVLNVVTNPGSVLGWLNNKTQQYYKSSRLEDLIHLN